MKRGEVRWYKFQAPDNNRPVLILSRDSVIGYLNEITVAPITTTIRDIPSEVILSEDDCIPRKCAVNCDHIQTIPKHKIGNMVTSLNSSKMKEVDEAVRFALGMN